MEATAVIVIFVLAGVWAAFLLPSVFTSRRERPAESAQEFTRLSARLTAVGSGTTIEPMLTRRRVLVRRRRALIILSAIALTTLAVAIWRGSTAMLIAHIAMDGVIAWYVAMLVQIRQRREASFVVDIRDSETDEAESQLQVLAHG
ncbi:MAG: hypothetical protein GXP34_06345 [Actinobacteria bacterium]|nr:hypothetical protein [Actinomycetota bacterium]